MLYIDCDKSEGMKPGGLFIPVEKIAKTHSIDQAIKT
jgi:hypothetical protein